MYSAIASPAWLCSDRIAGVGDRIAGVAEIKALVLKRFYRLLCIDLIPARVTHVQSNVTIQQKKTSSQQLT